MAMEDVAGTAERLAKDKVTTVPPQPFQQRVTQSLYSKVYSEDGREARNKRAEQRRIRATGIEKLGEEEYKRLLQEIDKMTQTPVNIEELIDKRMKELAERLEAEEKEKEGEEKCKSKDRPGTSTEATPITRSSTRKRKSETDTGKSESRKTDTDKSESRKTDPQPKLKVKQSEQTNKRWKRSAAIPMIEDDDEDDMEIIDKADKVDEPEEDDEDAYQMDDDNDDDFQEPPPRSQKIVKQSKKPTIKRRVEKSMKKKDEPEDKTLALFQRLVGPEFEVRALEEFEIDPKDKCGNPVEAAGFRATMKMLALGLKEAVKKGKNIEETYTDMINSTIEVAKAMNYPGASKVTLKEVLPAVKDLP